MWEHQDKTLVRSRTEEELALLWEMGTGKSREIVEILREKFATEKRVMRTLILCPAIVVKNWQNEFKTYSKIPESKVIPLIKSGKKRVQTFIKEATDPKTGTLTSSVIFITNYEAMEMKELHKLLVEWQIEILICDESQRLKNFQSVRAKKVAELLGETPIKGTRNYQRAVRFVYILTGTLILNTPMDLFFQFRILDSGKTFGLNFYEFRARFFEDENSGMPANVHFPKWVPRAESFEIFTKMIYRKAVRVLKKDCLDLPPLVRKTVYVDLGDDQRRLYDEMKNDFIAWVHTKLGGIDKVHKEFAQHMETYPEQFSDYGCDKNAWLQGFCREKGYTLESRAVVAQMALTKTLRLQQILSGYAKTEDGVEIPLGHNPRITELENLLADLTPENKVIVWATFHENYRQIADVCKKLKIKYVELHGGISASDKNKNIDAFRKDPDVRVVIGNQAAAGIGINLVEAAYSIFYSRNYSLEQDLQAEARNYRGGSEMHKSVTRIDIVANDTVDEMILTALAEKQNIAERILDFKDKL